VTQANATGFLETRDSPADASRDQQSFRATRQHLGELFGAGRFALVGDGQGDGLKPARGTIAAVFACEPRRQLAQLHTMPGIQQIYAVYAVGSYIVHDYHSGSIRH
jgi:hypothetical protein